MWKSTRCDLDEKTFELDLFDGSVGTHDATKFSSSKELVKVATSSSSMKETTEMPKLEHIIQSVGSVQLQNKGQFIPVQKRPRTKLENHSAVISALARNQSLFAAMMEQQSILMKPTVVRKSLQLKPKLKGLASQKNKCKSAMTAKEQKVIFKRRLPEECEQREPKKGYKTAQELGLIL